MSGLRPKAGNQARRGTRDFKPTSVWAFFYRFGFLERPEWLGKPEWPGALFLAGAGRACEADGSEPRPRFYNEVGAGAQIRRPFRHSDPADITTHVSGMLFPEDHWIVRLPSLLALFS